MQFRADVVSRMRTAHLLFLHMRGKDLINTKYESTVTARSITTAFALTETLRQLLGKQVPVLCQKYFVRYKHSVLSREPRSGSM